MYSPLGVAYCQMPAVDVPVELGAGGSDDFVLVNGQHGRPQQVPEDDFPVCSATSELGRMHVVPLDVRDRAFVSLERVETPRAQLRVPELDGPVERTTEQHALRQVALSAVVGQVT